MKFKAQPPPTRDWKKLRRAARSCRACPLYKCGTQTVFGEGALKAFLMVVGEQPGDKEDLSGHPFVGPAGTLFSGLCAELNIPRDAIYVTNAVKHFKFENRGQSRLHKKASVSEIKACHPWLESEIKSLQPKLILCLGATAALSVLGPGAKLTKERGELKSQSLVGVPAIMTWHPAAVLRSPDPEARKQKREELKQDLKKAWRRSQSQLPAGTM